MRVTEENFELLDHGVRELSESVASKVASRRNIYALDPMTVITIANCVIGIIKFLYICFSNKPRDILFDMRSPGFFQKIMIKRQIRKHVDKDMVDDMYYSLVQQAKEMTTTDVDNMLTVYKKNKMFKER